MASTAEQLDSCLLIPSKADGETDFPSVKGWYEIENNPLRMNTVCFVGSYRSLKAQLLKREQIDIDSFPNAKETFRGASGLTFTCENQDGAHFIMIWMPKFSWTILDFETLAHECLHASVMVMRMSGVKSKLFTAKNENEVDDEGLAYRQSTMFSELLKMMVEKQIRKYPKYCRKHQQ